MAWSTRQKQLVHQYSRWANLPDQEYRSLLRQVSGCASATHPALDNFHYEQFMARLETLLDSRVSEMLVPAPAAWRNRSYWRDKLPADGKANSRQTHEIYDWWYKLQPYIDPHKRNPNYLHAIASSACHIGRVRAMTDLSRHQAGLVIEALKDRLRWSLKDRNAAMAVPEIPDTSDFDIYHDDEAVPPDDGAKRFCPDEVPF